MLTFLPTLDQIVFDGAGAPATFRSTGQVRRSNERRDERHVRQSRINMCLRSNGRKEKDR